MRLRARADQASVHLEIPGGRTQTAWFFTETGNLISAGHGLKDLPDPRAVRYNISRLSQTWTAKLLDYQIGMAGDSADFAIFEILEQPSEKTNIYLPISQSVANGPFEYPQRDAFVCGYVKAISDAYFSFSVIVESATRPGGVSNRSYFLCSGAELDANGMSGGALCLENNGTYGGGIGLQVIQPPSFTNFYAAQPLSEIYSCSKIFKTLLTEQWNRQKNHVWPLRDLEIKLSNHSKIGNRFRHAVFIRKYKNNQEKDNATNSVNDEFYDELNEVLGTYQNNTKTLVKKLIWLDQKMLDHPISWDVSASGWEGVKALKINQVITTHFSDESRDRQTKEAKLLVDLSGKMQFEKTPGKVFGLPSDFVVVQINDEPPQIKIDMGNSGDLFITLTVADPAILLSQLRFILEDIILDECIFYGIPILRERFQTPEAKMAFEHAKLEFIRQNQSFLTERAGSSIQPKTWHLGGMAIPDSHIGYFPLSTYARVGPDMDQDSQRLEIIWRTFTEDFLLPALCEREEGLAPVLEDETIIQKILGKKLFGGRVSERRLREVLRSSNTQNVGREFTELVAIIFYKRKPKKRYRHAALYNLFESRRLGSIAIIRESQLQQLFDLIPYVEFNLLRRA